MMHKDMTSGTAGAIAFGIGLLAAACGAGSPVMPTETSGAGSRSTAVSAGGDGSSCALELHAILRETAGQQVAGSVQFRIVPGASDDVPVLSYAAVFGPTGDLEYSGLSASLRSAIPDQLPTWTDVQKADPGTTATEIIRFGRETLVSPDLVASLVEDPSRYKAVVSVVGASGGREAEGLVAPESREPETLRDRHRTCFGIGALK